MMDRHQIAAVLAEIAAILEIKGENVFKVRAYEGAARIVEGLSNLDELIREGRLTSIKGIGKNLAEHITELYKTGRLREYDELIKSIPKGLLEMLKIPGVGPKKVKVFWEKLGIETIGELEYACRENRLRDLPGFGERSQEKILEGIEYLKRFQGRFLYPYAMATAILIYEGLQKDKKVKRLEIAGSLRRKRETVKDIDIVASTDDPSHVMDLFISLPIVEEVVARGDTKSSILTRSGINADLRCVKDEEFAHALLHFTGSKEHNVAMRARAKKMGFKINEYALIRGEKSIHCKNEEEIFEKLLLPFIPPELREDMGEIEAAEQGRLPKLIEGGEIKGIIHVHTDYSDGSNTIEEMAIAARDMGYSYIGICDHSESAAYAGGLRREDVIRQHEEIDRLNNKLKGIRILKGIELDILPDGSVDYDEGLLQRFEFTIASIHSRFSMDEEEMTRRICKALENRYVDILGHPTGRLLLARDAYKVDMNKVIEVAAQYGKAIELNANPNRLDIDWRLGPLVKKLGVKIAISVDAHEVGGLSDMMYGVGVARKSWYTKEDVLNTLEYPEFLRWIRRRRDG